jgi:hypothetical protein
VSTYEPKLRAELSFGDICEAEFLYDVHVRADARSMGREVAPAKFAKKMWGMDEDLTYFVPALDPKQGDNFVLARGTHSQAILLSDDCVIATVLGRDTGKPTNKRLIFAPLAPAADADLDTANFGRFPLLADEQFDEPLMADLRRCFMADGRDVHAALDAGGFRARSLTEDTRGELAIRWSAYALRRGPFVAEDSLEKFAEYAIDSGLASEEAVVDASSKLFDVVGAAWGYEGRGVEVAGNAREDKRDPRQVVEVLIEELEQLRGVADDALAALRQL